MAQRRSFNRDLVIIAGLSVVTVVLWIGVTVYRSLETTTIPKVLQEQLKPLRPDFDTRVLNNLNLRSRISDRELGTLPPRTLNLEGETALTQQPISTVAAGLTAPESSPAATLP